jgi:DNA-binding XRE family transcriptional regulator
MSDIKNKKGINSMTKLKGYRVMLGKTQRDMAKELNISVQSYNNKETGKTAFNDREKLAIKTMVSEVKSDITIDELFY